MILRAKVVVTMDGPPLGDAAVVIEGARIAAVEPWRNGLATAHQKVFDLGEVALLPGLINAHCHLDYTMLRAVLPPPASFVAWVRSINGYRTRFKDDDYAKAIQEGLEEALRYGTTSMVNLTGVPQLAGSVQSPVRMTWCPEFIDLRKPADVAGALADLGGKQVGLAPHAPFTASPELYRRCEALARTHDCLLTTHLAESREEMQMSFDLGGALAEMLNELGVPLHECNGLSPVEHFVSYCEPDKRWLLAHVNEIVEEDLTRLSRTHIVHCPRSHAYFRHSKFRLKELEAAGANICLGTDSLASNFDLSLLAEIRALQRAHPALVPEKLLRYVTVNPARALRRSAELGQLRPGCLADIVAVPCFSLSTAYEEIIAHEGSVSAVLISGRLIPCS